MLWVRYLGEEGKKVEGKTKGGEIGRMKGGETGRTGEKAGKIDDRRGQDS